MRKGLRNCTYMDLKHLLWYSCRGDLIIRHRNFFVREMARGDLNSAPPDEKITKITLFVSYRVGKITLSHNTFLSSPQT